MGNLRTTSSFRPWACTGVGGSGLPSLATRNAVFTLAPHHLLTLGSPAVGLAPCSCCLFSSPLTETLAWRQTFASVGDF